MVQNESQGLPPTSADLESHHPYKQRRCSRSCPFNSAWNLPPPPKIEIKQLRVCEGFCTTAVWGKCYLLTSLLLISEIVQVEHAGPPEQLPSNTAWVFPLVFGHVLDRKAKFDKLVGERAQEPLRERFAAALAVRVSPEFRVRAYKHRVQLGCVGSFGSIDSPSVSSGTRPRSCRPARRRHPRSVVARSCRLSTRARARHSCTGLKTIMVRRSAAEGEYFTQRG